MVTSPIYEVIMEYTYKTTEKYARIICYECIEMARDGWFGEENREYNGEKFLTREQYSKQMEDPNRGWRCPDCRCYPCDWDDDYWELPLREQ